MRLLYRTAIRFPITTIAVGFGLTLAIAPGVLRLKLRTDGHALAPQGAPEILIDEQIRRDFGLDDPIVVLIQSEHPEGIFNCETLELVDRLTQAFLAMDGVRASSVFSLATEYGDRVWPGTIRFRRFLEPFPENEEDYARLRNDLHKIAVYTGTIVSNDDRATAVMVGVPSGMSRTDLYGRVHEVIRELGPVPDELHVIGAPVAEALLGTHILEDLGVPYAVLGHRTFTEGENGAGPGPVSGVYQLRMWVARYVGLLPLTVGVMAAVFLICFRSVIAMALPMMEVGAGLTVVFGLMGYTGVPVYLTIAVLPVVLVVSGVTDEIHVFTRYTELLKRQFRDAAADGGIQEVGPAAQPDHIPVLHEAMDELWRAVVIASLTTAVGCGSFVFSPLAPVRAFGVFTAIGVLFSMFWSITVIPAMLSLINPRRFIHVRSVDAGAAVADKRFFERLGPWVVRHRWAALGLAIGVVVLAPAGVRRIQIQDSWIDGFAPESEFFRGTQSFNQRFLGTHLLHVCIDTHLSEPLTGELGATDFERQTIRMPPDLVADPATLVGRWIRVRRLEDVPGESRGVGMNPEPIKFQPWEARIDGAERAENAILIRPAPRRGSARAALRLLPQDRSAFEIFSRPMSEPSVLNAIAEFEAFLESRTADAVGGVLGPATYIETTNFMVRGRAEEARSVPNEGERIEWLWSQYERIRGIDHRRRVVNSEYSRGIATIYLNNANFIATARLMEAIREYEREHLVPLGMTASFGGDVAVSQTLIDAIVTTQVRSLVGSLVGILLLTAILGRSLLWGVLSALPCSLAVLINFAIMGYVGVPLGVATSMFTGMTLGMGVDYAIHMLERYRWVRRRGYDTSEAVADAVSITGPAVFVDALAVALGFGVMTLSQVPANSRLGGLVILSLITCLAATFLLLPALLHIFHPRAGATAETAREGISLAVESA